MAAGRSYFGALQRDMVAAMDGFDEAELAAAARFLTAMVEVIERHARAAGPG
jgi:hypothetical protein